MEWNISFVVIGPKYLPVDSNLDNFARGMELLEDILNTFRLHFYGRSKVQRLKDLFHL